MHFKIENYKIFIFDAYQQRERLKAIGARWSKRRRAWWLSHDLDSVEALRQAVGLKVPAPSLPRPARPVPAITPEATGLIIQGLYTHQKTSVAVARGLPFFADFSEPGTGKTLVQIELMLERDEWPVLVVCPKSITHAVWRQQLLGTGYFRPPNVHVLEGGSEKVSRQLRTLPSAGRRVVIINYEMVPRVIDELLEVPWAAVVLDESTRIKNPNAKRSKAVMRLRDHVSWRAIMTGTPAPNGLLDIFNQVRFLDPRLFGESWYAFRQRYMEQKPWDAFNWYPRPGAFQVIRTRLAPFSVAHKKRECVDLPPLVHEERLVDMTAAQARAYRQMRDELLLELEEQTIVAPFTITKLMKLRQLANGFAYDTSTGEALHVGSNKPAELLDLLDELDDEQVIVFTHFQHTGRLLHDIFQQKDVKHVWVTADTKDKQAEVKKFESGDVRVLLANTAIMAHGWNLQFCSNVVFYEHDFALENYEQAVQRIERIGQRNKMTVYHLLTAGTLEPKILERLQKKIDLNRQLDVSAVREMLK